jgi:hypothetical protein
MYASRFVIGFTAARARPAGAFRQAVCGQARITDSSNRSIQREPLWGTAVF